MQSANYHGIEDLRKRAERHGGTVDKPYLAGQDWWTIIRLPGLTKYEGTVREVNGFMQGYEALMPIPGKSDYAHNFQVMCSGCLDEPIDVEDPQGTCPESQYEAER